MFQQVVHTIWNFYSDRKAKTLSMCLSSICWKLIQVTHIPEGEKSKFWEHLIDMRNLSLIHPNFQRHFYFAVIQITYIRYYNFMKTRKYILDIREKILRFASETRTYKSKGVSGQFEHIQFHIRKRKRSSHQI